MKTGKLPRRQLEDLLARVQTEDPAVLLGPAFGEDAVDDPLPAFPGADLHGQLQAFAALLGRHVTRTNAAHAEALATALRPGVVPRGPMSSSPTRPSTIRR